MWRLPSRAVGLAARNAVVLFTRDESGADLVEYALIVGVIAVACTLSLTQIGSGIKELIGAISDLLATNLP